MNYRISTSNERVWCTTQLAKLSFNHSLGRTHSWRFSNYLPGTSYKTWILKWIWRNALRYSKTWYQIICGWFRTTNTSIIHLYCCTAAAVPVVPGTSTGGTTNGSPGTSTGEQRMALVLNRLLYTSQYKVSYTISTRIYIVQKQDLTQICQLQVAPRGDWSLLVNKACINLQVNMILPKYVITWPAGVSYLLEGTYIAIK